MKHEKSTQESQGIRNVMLLLVSYCKFYVYSSFSFRRNVTFSVTGGFTDADFNKTCLQLRTVYRAFIFGNKRGARMK